MRTVLLFSLLTLILTGCNLTKGMGPSGLVQNGCGNHCTSRDYYLPGKGVWADDKPIDKSTIGGELHERSLLASANTQPVNIFGLCGISFPIHNLLNNKDNKTLPIGLQIICGKNEDEKAVEIALALENYLGEPQLPDVSKFL